MLPNLLDCTTVPVSEPKNPKCYFARTRVGREKQTRTCNMPAWRRPPYLHNCLFSKSEATGRQLLLGATLIGWPERPRGYKEKAAQPPHSFFPLAGWRPWSERALPNRTQAVEATRNKQGSGNYKARHLRTRRASREREQGPPPRGSGRPSAWPGLGCIPTTKHLRNLSFAYTVHFPTSP